jgi:hypothetical protein
MNRMIRQAEVDIMIAVPSHCKRNLGAKITFMMMHYALSCLDISCFCVKIHETNVPSLRLFGCKLGYERYNFAPFFDKYVLECVCESPEEIKS